MCNYDCTCGSFKLCKNLRASLRRQCYRIQHCSDCNYLISSRCKWGLLSGFVFSIIQLIQTASTLSYATSFWAAVTIIFLDYIFAFTVIGLAGFLRNKVSNPSAAAVTGTVGVCALRYICHVISGCTVWAGVSIPSTDGLLYSLSYNATYMIPETIINAAAVFWLFGCLNFRSEKSALQRKLKRTLQKLLRHQFQFFHL